MPELLSPRCTLVLRLKCLCGDIAGMEVTAEPDYETDDVEDYGVNEVSDAIDTLAEGDHIRLNITYQTEADSELHHDTFDAEVSKTLEQPTDPVKSGPRARLDTLESGRFSPPRGGDWYIASSATAMREGSHTAYTIDQMYVWRAEEEEEPSPDHGLSEFAADAESDSRKPEATGKE